ncbi:MAG: hypothetical protein R2857_07935 [Vampirovibrionales bacterium]
MHNQPIFADHHGMDLLTLLLLTATTGVLALVLTMGLSGWRDFVEHRRVRLQATPRQPQSLSSQNGQRVPKLVQPDTATSTFARWCTDLAMAHDDVSAKSTTWLLNRLITYRFEFTRHTIGPEFPAQVAEALNQLPKVFLEIMVAHGVPLELDVVGEPPAMADVGGPNPKLHLNKFFLIDETLYRSQQNPVFPYDLPGVLAHEFAHYLDWHCMPDIPDDAQQRLLGHGHLTGRREFCQAWQACVAAIPHSEHMPTEDEWAALIATVGGQLHLPKEQQDLLEVSFFINRPEEVFAECLVYLLYGTARRPVLSYFMPCVPVVEALLREGLQACCARPRQ